MGFGSSSKWVLDIGSGGAFGSCISKKVTLTGRKIIFEVSMEKDMGKNKDMKVIYTPGIERFPEDLQFILS